MSTTFPHAWIGEAAERFRRGEAVDVPLPGGGRLRIDRPLPYLLVHRTAAAPDDDATHRLLSSEASHLVWRGGEEHAEEHADGHADELTALVRELVRAGSEAFGGFLLLELWASTEPSHDFRIHGPDGEARGTVETLRDRLAELRTVHHELDAAVEPTDERAPPGLPPLLTIPECYRLECLLLGVEVPPVYLDPEDRTRGYPVFFRRFKEHFTRALRRAIHEFIRVHTEAHVETYRVLGAQRVDEAVWETDRALEAISRAFDFLLMVSPIDEARAWDAFRASGFERAPDFHYRLLPVDPATLKRRLYEIELERVDDPAFLYLLADKREDLDRHISMLAERGSRDFLYSSIRLYHPVDDVLLRTAESLLSAIAPSGDGTRGAQPGGAARAAAAPVGAARVATSPVDAAAFQARALEEFDHYRAIAPEFAPRAQVRPDLVGVMVSRGNLLIDQRLRLDPARVEALLQHEIGTHVLTYFNGAAQPLRQLASGLADYDELQEGLGILAEYLAGGLTAARMRVLAGRVVAAKSVEDGADFVETFRRLTREHGFGDGSAFDIATRAHEGGGHTRDLIYLRGFVRLLEYLRDGGELEPLYIGKIALRHVPVVTELRERGILRDPPLRPRLLALPEAAERLRTLRTAPALEALVQDAAA